MARGERSEFHPGRQVGREIMLPRLSAAMQRQGILSEGEAQSAIRGLRAGDTGGGGEAVWHYGGAPKLAADAFRNRHLGARKVEDLSDDEWLRHMMGKFGPGNT